MLDMDQEYNNRAAVPDHMAVMDGWQHDSAAYRELNPPEFFKYDDSPRCTIDMFRASQTSAGTAIALFIHGGYWQAFEGASFSHVAKGPNACGIDVAIVSYDLCPDVRVADIVDQMRRAVIFLWQAERRQIVPFGHSAGGHLTAALLATDWSMTDKALPSNLTDRGYSISGLFDLVPLVGTFVNGKMRMDAAEATEASPLFAPHVAGKTLISTVGEMESSEYHRQSRLVTHVWRAHGATTDMHVEGGKNHFTILDDLANPSSTMTRTVAALCKPVEMEANVPYGLQSLHRG